MIRFTWLQSRLPILIGLAALATAALVALITGPDLTHLYDTTVAHCNTNGNCPAATAALAGSDHFLQTALADLVVVAPALLGIFWAAPLVAHELETGTHRLAWTQSVTRTRWLTTKISVSGLASIALAGLLSLTVTWWFSPIDRVNNNRFTPAVFDQRGVVALGYTAFAFALGLTAGTAIRRALPAMATTLAAYVAVRTAVTEWIRPHFQAPLTIAGPKLSGPIGRAGGGIAPPQPGDWVLSHSTRASCTTGTGANQHACPGAIRQVIYTVQPPSRYWPFQWYETALFVTLALILITLSYWWVRQKLTLNRFEPSQQADRRPEPEPDHRASGQ